MIPGSQKPPGPEKTPPRRQNKICARKGINLLELRPSQNYVTPPCEGNELALFRFPTVYKFPMMRHAPVLALALTLAINSSATRRSDAPLPPPTSLPCPPSWMKPTDYETRSSDAGDAGDSGDSGDSGDAGVCVLFLGELRVVDEKHWRTITQTLQGSKVFVVTSTEYAHVAAALAGSSHGTTRTLFVNEKSIDMASNMYQFWHLTRGLQTWRQALTENCSTIVRSRTDFQFPPAFTYALLHGFDDVVNARSDTFFYSSTATFYRLFEGFFELARTKYTKTHAASQEDVRRARMKNLVTCTLSAAALKMGKGIPPRKPDIWPASHTTHWRVPDEFAVSRSTDGPQKSVLTPLYCSCSIGNDQKKPWANTQGCNGNGHGEFCSEASFAYHIISNDASCEPVSGATNPPKLHEMRRGCQSGVDVPGTECESANRTRQTNSWGDHMLFAPSDFKLRIDRHSAKHMPKC